MTSVEQWSRERVENSRQLKPYADIIFADWPNWDEHMKWVAVAPIRKIISWAKATQK